MQNPATCAGSLLQSTFSKEATHRPSASLTRRLRHAELRRASADLESTVTARSKENSGVSAVRQISQVALVAERILSVGRQGPRFTVMVRW